MVTDLSVITRGDYTILTADPGFEFRVLNDQYLRALEILQEKKEVCIKNPADAIKMYLKDDGLVAIIHTTEYNLRP